MSEDFAGFIARLVKRAGTAQAIADAIGMSLSAFSRGVRNEGTLNLDNCLRLAEWAGEDPAYVLRLAGKGESADRIMRLFGAPSSPLSSVDRELLALPSGVKEKALHLVRAISPEAAEKLRRA